MTFVHQLLDPVRLDRIIRQIPDNRDSLLKGTFSFEIVFSIRRIEAVSLGIGSPSPSSCIGDGGNASEDIVYNTLFLG